MVTAIVSCEAGNTHRRAAANRALRHRLFAGAGINARSRKQSRRETLVDEPPAKPNHRRPHAGNTRPRGTNVRGRDDGPGRRAWFIARTTGALVDSTTFTGKHCL